MNGTKQRFPRALALSVAREICLFLKPHCAPFRHGPDGVALIVAGSLRRRKEAVGDVEILYIPRFEPIKEFRQSDLLSNDPPKLENKVDSELNSLLRTAVIIHRLNALGSVVCRTGGAENNVRVAAAAQKKGWQWNPYNSGFTDHEGNRVKVESEQDVYRLAGLPYLEPWQR